MLKKLIHYRLICDFCGDNWPVEAYEHLASQVVVEEYGWKRYHKEGLGYLISKDLCPDCKDIKYRIEYWPKED